MNSPTSLMLLITKMEGAGAQKIMLETARYFQSRPEYRVIAVCLYDQNYIQEAYAKYGVQVLDLKMKNSRSHLPLLANVFRILTGCFRLYRLLRSESIQLLQTYDFYANAIGVFVGRLARVQVIVMSQRVVYTKRWRCWIDHIISRWADKVTAVSESVREFCVKMEGMPADHVVVIRNGIYVTPTPDAQDHAQIRHQLHVDDDTLLVGAVGRLSTQKGHRILIQAAPLILSNVPNVKFVIVGQGPGMTELRAYVSQLRLDGFFIFTGHVSNIVPLLTAMDLYVHPSLWEGMPNAVLEAMACGKPIIATDVDGTVELLIDGESGYLIPPNEVEPLATAVSYLLTHPDEAQKMGNAARQRAASQFSLDTTMTATVHLYKSLLSNRSQ
jgi:glycosyltransferase involved in cell wall biosynthesis